MGQYWKLVNIDRRQELRGWGKLGEVFFRRFDDVIELLAGPWAGCRIMCIGDNMGKCPPDVLISEEATEIKNLPGRSYYSDEDEDSSDADDPSKTLYRLSDWRYKEIESTEYVNLRGMVLRNLTKHVYVRRDVVIEELKRSGRGGDIGNILLTDICWSEDSSCAMMLDLSRGGWAGVVPLSSVEDEEEEWEDVTGDQVKLTRFALRR
ncbi:uncharacterized protein EV420DRAFT_1122655 [Desarmillaria tabescens]|uniref:Uncharacterized protein n=1 Tax=Armillaria tabescens TaxID=1929756 RepID=A0AA39MPH0_ARMTA|nr:uncharacterized protein EV420DRAFT_1122655 [Desarmillaria tabescens]KAK0441244.1 hypothetical protein EV420DRAFT_1122655 [Desarmillaria tabescens]